MVSPMVQWRFAFAFLFHDMVSNTAVPGKSIVVSHPMLFCACCPWLPSAAQTFMLNNVVVPVASQFGVSSQYEYLEGSIQRFPRGQCIMLIENSTQNQCLYQQSTYLLQSDVLLGQGTSAH